MKFSEKVIKKRLKNLKGWKLEKSKSSIESAKFTNQKALYKKFKFKNFFSAMQFLNKVAKISEKYEHHPDFLLHDWNKVSIWITTHSEGGITELDFKLAKAIEGIR